MKIIRLQSSDDKQERRFLVFDDVPELEVKDGSWVLRAWSRRDWGSRVCEISYDDGKVSFTRIGLGPSVRDAVDVALSVAVSNGLVDGAEVLAKDGSTQKRPDLAYSDVVDAAVAKFDQDNDPELLE
jgi:hypothetical protein